ncbi:MAG: hypothetical protein IJL45_04715 [Prevotella sp.]|nr:hypothetical protein [Prevotella sp.]
MKKMIVIAVLAAMSVSASAMSYTQAREEALFLSDKMAYELNLTLEQYEAVYEINLDYLMSISVKGDIHGIYWDRRDIDLRYVLDVYQYALYKASKYFYRPVYWKNSHFNFRIYERYVNRNVFYHNRPNGYISYRGGYNKRPYSYYSDKPQAHLGSRLPIVNGAGRYISGGAGSNNKPKNTVANSQAGHNQAGVQPKRSTSAGSKNSHFGGHK